MNFIKNFSQTNNKIRSMVFTDRKVPLLTKYIRYFIASWVYIFTPINLLSHFFFYRRKAFISCLTDCYVLGVTVFLLLMMFLDISAINIALRYLAIIFIIYNYINIIVFQIHNLTESYQGFISGFRNLVLLGFNYLQIILIYALYYKQSLCNGWRAFYFSISAITGVEKVTDLAIASEALLGIFFIVVAIPKIFSIINAETSK